MEVKCVSIDYLYWFWLASSGLTTYTFLHALLLYVISVNKYNNDYLFFLNIKLFSNGKSIKANHVEWLNQWMIRKPTWKKIWFYPKIFKKCKQKTSNFFYILSKTLFAAITIYFYVWIKFLYTLFHDLLMGWAVMCTFHNMTNGLLTIYFVVSNKAQEKEKWD